MTSLPSGLASISSRLDDTPNVRGAVDMAERLRRAEEVSKAFDRFSAAMNEIEADRRHRRAEALSALAEMDAPYIGNEDPTEVLEAAARARICARMAEAAYDYWSAPDTLGSAIDRHAQLAVSAGYRSADRR